MIEQHEDSEANIYRNSSNKRATDSRSVARQEARDGHATNPSES